MSQKIKKKFIEDQIFTDISDDITTAKEAVEGNLDDAIHKTIEELDDALAAEKDAGIEGSLAKQIADEQGAREADDLALSARIDGVENSISTLDGNYATDQELSAAVDAIKGDAAEEYNTLGKLEDKIQDNAADIATLNGDSSVEGSVAKAIADVVGAAPEALDTLEEIAASLANDPNLDSTLRTLIDTNIDTAKQELKGAVSEAFDTMEEIEAEFTKLNGDSSVAGSVDYKVAAAEDAIKGDAAEEYNTLGKLEDKIQEDAQALAAEKDATVEGSLAHQIDANAQAISDLEADTSVQDELDATQAGAGLEADGSYVPGAGSKIATATSLKDADDKLSDAIDANATALDNEKDAAVVGSLAHQISANAQALADEKDAAVVDSLAYKIQDNADAIGVLNGDSSVEGSVAKAIADVINMAPEALNTLDELAAAIGDDENFATTVTTMFSELKGGVSEAFDTMKEIEDEFAKLNGDSSTPDSIDYKVAAAEDAIKGDAAEEYNTLGKLEDKIQQDAQALADEKDAAVVGSLAHQIAAEKARVDALEAVNVVWIKEKFVLGTDAGATEAGGVWSVALSHSPVSGSESVFVGRLAMHDEDYTMSGSDVSLDGSALIDGGEQDLVAGDVVYVKYQYQA